MGQADIEKDWDTEAVIIRICSYHEKYWGYRLKMGEKAPFDDKSATHGICPKCEAKLEADQKAKEEEEERGQA